MGLGIGVAVGRRGSASYKKLRAWGLGSSGEPAIKGF